MTPTMVMGLSAATAIAFVVALYQIAADLFLRDRARISDRVDLEFIKKKVAKSKKASLFKNLEQMDAAAREGDDRPTLARRFEAMIEQSGMDLTSGRLLTISAVIGGTMGVLAFSARGGPIEAAIAAPLGFLAPILFVKRRRDARMEKLRSQLPEAFDLMARMVRAGQSLNQALLGVAQEFPQPISMEFAYCYEQQNLGLPAEAAFRDLTRRAGVIELKIFVLAVLVQRQTGGNLAELLSKLAGVVRERYQIRGTISALTAEGRMQGWILAAMPPAMLLILLVMNFNYAIVLFDHPNLLMVTFGAELLGVLWIRKIVNFDF